MKQIRTEPDYNGISDEDLIGLVAWCEKWKLAEVYDIAHKQVQMDPHYDFGEWMLKGTPQLPIPVRLELQRAAKISYDAGRMWRLQIAHWCIRLYTMVFRHMSYAFFAFVLAYWILR